MTFSGACRYCKHNFEVFFLAHTFWQRVQVLFHEALNPLQVQLDQHIVKLRALIVPHIDDVLQIWDGELLEALLQKVQHLVSGQSLHLCQILGEDLRRREIFNPPLKYG